MVGPTLQGSDVPAVQKERVVDFGHLRHAHWLAPRDGKARWATAAVTGADLTDRHAAARWGRQSVVEIRGEECALEARLAVPFRLLPNSTWTRRPQWRVLELDGATWVVCIDEGNGRLHVFDLASGSEVMPARPGHQIHAVRQAAGGAELLVAVGAGLERLVLRPGATSELVAVTLQTGLDQVGAAAFAEPLPGAERSGAPDVWAVGWRSAGLAFARAREATPSASDALAAAVYPLGFESPTPRGSELRLDAVRASERTWLALGDPSYESGVGRVLVAEADEGGPRLLHAGRIHPELRGNISDSRDWGQCVRFVPDADADDVPDLVVAGPWTTDDVQVDLVSVGRWARLASHGAPFFESCGHWVDLSPDGRSVLVGGTRQQGYPEHLAYDGMLMVLDARTLERKSIVRLAPVERPAGR